MITPEIAERYGVSEHTVRKSWTQHPEWPTPKGKRGRFKEYGADDVAAWVREHVQRAAVELEPNRLYTAQQLDEAGIGVKAGTIRADVSRGRWPAPDDEEHGVKRWRGATAMAAVASRRAYRRSE
ncbi:MULTISPECIES: hypothetical protein [Streptomycetaceae]|uniref:hypothetical protein n=2 Tax=Kitasatosporales TaxID=85011 RepID=UPI001F43E3FC|nr:MULTISPECIES: hypothetical protein [Streptomycetaceae]